MRSLIVSTRLSRDESNPWLYDGMLQELRRRGHEVMVLLLDLSGTWKQGDHHYKGVTVIAYPVLGSNKALRFFYLFLGNLYLLKRVLYKKFPKFDFMFCCSIFSVSTLPLLFLIKTTKIKEKVGFIWDFFPIHHSQVRSVPIFLQPIVPNLLRWLESYLIKSFDHIGVMSKKNEIFFHEYHPGYKGNIFIGALWASEYEQAPVRKTKYTGECLKIVFGGQIQKGRGINLIVELARSLHASGIDNIMIDVYGDGPLTDFLEHKIKCESLQGVLQYKGFLGKAEYLTRLRDYDVGLIVTVPNVTVPTFPSKVIDYYFAGLPVLACVESSTDFGEIVQNEAQAGLFCPVDDLALLLDKVKSLHDLKKSGSLGSMGLNGHLYYKKNFQIEAAWDDIMSKIGGDR